MYFEEFSIGNQFELEPVTLTSEEIDAFARQFDPQPIHVDPLFAEQGMFGGVIASGFHTVSAVWNAWIQSNHFGKEVIVGTGMDYITWTAPVRPGDTLHTVVEVAEVTPFPHRNRGAIALKFTSVNQDQQVTLKMQGRALIRMRPEIHDATPDASAVSLQDLPRPLPCN